MRREWSEHEWIKHEFSGGLALTCCAKCGIVRRRDASSDARECKGVVKIALRDRAALKDTTHAE